MQRFVVPSRASALAISVASLACNDASAFRQPPAPPPAPSSAAPQSSGAVPRSTLAILGYYTEEEGQRAWKETHATCPGALDGSEMLGRTLPEWHLTTWHNTPEQKPLSLASLRGRVVVTRFWTAGCGFCEKTLPALEALSHELEGEPVTFVAAFHGKPVADFPTLDKPMEVIEAWDVHFPVALDPEWKTLQSWWLEGAHRHATSVTFVVGKDGTLLHVHPGPVFHPSDDPDESDQNRDYLAVRAAIYRGLSRAIP